jgi:hypothetical protein
MEQAIIKQCPGHIADPLEHSMRDFCGTCGEYWIDIPYCPKCESRLKSTETQLGVKAYCQECKKHYLIKPKKF